jgi:Flp pilus assembly protein TadB
MYLRMPGHFSVLLEDPLGVRMIVAAVVLQIVGAVLIRRLSNVEY